MNPIPFDSAFQALTGNPPLPWQRALYERFIPDRPDNIPASCNLPTGLGKTSVIAVWLIALANKAAVPRRLVYVVNRRTVVDQTTDEVEKYRNNLRAAGLFDVLKERCAAPLKHDDSPLALSTLRGQFADNREWSADPSRPAVICGTVDMIGSRLLFSGYGVGMKAKPLHAGFLGQDALIVHDEAHLEPAFQKLIETIRDEQARCNDFNPLRVMELTATSRGTAIPFGLTDDDRKNTTVLERVSAKKTVYLMPEEKKLAEQIAAKALGFKDRNRAVLVFTSTVDDVLKVAGKLPKDRVVTLTGTMRGRERDALVEDAIFKRFMPGGQSDTETTYLVCTSAGEVGVNISADHLVCDLSTFDSMAQRFGRVNRFGKRTDTEIHVAHPITFEDDDYDQRRMKTLALLRELNGDGSPDALGKLDATARQDAFAPTPTLLPATDILFDAWAHTTITDKLPGRPPVEPYLHGLPTSWQPPETHVAWRTEVEKLNVKPWTEWEQKEFAKFATDLLDEYPLKPHELLKDNSRRVYDRLKKLAAPPDTPVWLQSDDGAVRPSTLGDVIEGDADDLNYLTVILPPSAGGLNSQGMLDEKWTDRATDVADDWFLDKEKTKRGQVRVWTDDEQFDAKTDGMHSVLRIEFALPEDDEDAEGKVWLWFVKANEGDKSAKLPVLWKVHVKDVVDRTKEIVANLPLDEKLKEAIITAAEYHDHGKRRKLFQTVLGNAAYPKVVLAKSGKKGGRVKETYRHEFGSLLDADKALTGEHCDLILHLIAAHHGRARPHFPPDEAFDPERPHADAEQLATKVPQRFARLQLKYGRWGLAYLESLLRAADWAASANPTAFVMEGDQ
jgi:CRISPR-associated endonuclease/helicase Cas3